jgi:hypothetical protein
MQPYMCVHLYTYINIFIYINIYRLYYFYISIIIYHMSYLILCGLVFACVDRCSEISVSCSSYALRFIRRRAAAHMRLGFKIDTTVLSPPHTNAQVISSVMMIKGLSVSFLYLADRVPSSSNSHRLRPVKQLTSPSRFAEAWNDTCPTMSASPTRASTTSDTLQRSHLLIRAQRAVAN